jgi:hypothetical protein
VVEPDQPLAEHARRAEGQEDKAVAVGEGAGDVGGQDVGAGQVEPVNDVSDRGPRVGHGVWDIVGGVRGFEVVEQGQVAADEGRSSRVNAVRSGSTGPNLAERNGGCQTPPCRFGPCWATSDQHSITFPNTESD